TRDDVEVVGLCDLADARRARWGQVFPDARQTADIDDVLATAPDVVDVLVPAARNGAMLRVLEDYLFYPPLAQLRAVVDSGELGAPTAVHMKIVGTGRGGWDVPESSFRWQWEQQADG